MDRKVIHALLRLITNATVNGNPYQSIAALQPPFGLGQDPNGRFLFNFNIEVRRPSEVIA